MTGNKYPEIKQAFHNFYDRTPKNLLMEMIIDYIRQLYGEDTEEKVILAELMGRRNVMKRIRKHNEETK